MIMLITYLVILSLWLLYVLINHLSWHTQETKINNLKKYGVLQKICQENFKQFIVIVLVNVLIYFYFFVVMLQVLSLLNVQTFLSVFGFGFMMAVISVNNCKIEIRKKVVEKGALYL